MLFFIFTTGLCNLRCDYCGGSFPEKLVPPKPSYDIDSLIRFLEDCKTVSIVFYGGEPLLNAKFISKFMDSFDAERYIIQTNGLLLEKLDPIYWRRMDTVLMSIDGVEYVTDKHRGTGVYSAVVDSAYKLRSLGFDGDLVARMTVTEDTDIYRDVLHLIELGLFDHIHWQLNVVWSPPWMDFDGWCRRYMNGLSRLLDLWIYKLEFDGAVLGISPFQGCLKRIIEGGLYPPCGAGVDAYAISTDGSILVCPISVDVDWGRLGNIYSNTLDTLKTAPKIGEPCISCIEFKVCGGRCLYAYMEKLWGIDGFRRICNVTMSMISLLRSRLNLIEDALKIHGIRMDSILYPRFNNSIEIIP
jgi:putative peptide-modifying radical SAM enzyme